MYMTLQKTTLVGMVDGSENDVFQHLKRNFLPHYAAIWVGLISELNYNIWVPKVKLNITSKCYFTSYFLSQQK
jgi:hypothetical protein